MEGINVVYLDNLLKKFDIIKGVWITDIEGNLLASSVNPGNILLIKI
jgi:hypothetical protein